MPFIDNEKAPNSQRASSGVDLEGMAFPYR